MTLGRTTLDGLRGADCCGPIIIGAASSMVAKAWSTPFEPNGTGSAYFDGPGSDETYVRDIDNGDIRTEGMSYGLMIALQLDHQTEFEWLWSFARKHLMKAQSGRIGEGSASPCPEFRARVTTVPQPNPPIRQRTPHEHEEAKATDC